MFLTELQLLPALKSFTAWAEVTDTMEAAKGFEISWGVLAKRLLFIKN